MWVKIKASEVEEYRRLEVFPVSKTARSVLDPLYDGVDALADRVGDAVFQVGQDVV